MHPDLGRRLTASRNDCSLRVNQKQILRFEHSFTGTRWRNQNAFRTEANGQITFGCDNQTALVHPLADAANLSSMVVFPFSKFFTLIN
jgi:hypothetical protein